MVDTLDMMRRGRHLCGLPPNSRPPLPANHGKDSDKHQLRHVLQNTRADARQGQVIQARSLRVCHNHRKPKEAGD